MISATRKPVQRGKGAQAKARAAKAQRIIELIQLWADIHGEPPKVADWKNVRGTGWPSYLTVIRHYGSWDEAIFAAGFQPRGRGRPIEPI